MTEIELHAKSDRELLLLAVQKLNAVCPLVEKHEKFIYGNGTPGVRTQVYILWGCFVIVGSLLIKVVFY